jgi:hypothetical protein
MKEEDRVQQDGLRLRDIVAMLAEHAPFALLPPMLFCTPTHHPLLYSLSCGFIYFLFSTE